MRFFFFCRYRRDNHPCESCDKRSHNVDQPEEDWGEAGLAAWEAAEVARLAKVLDDWDPSASGGDKLDMPSGERSSTDGLAEVTVELSLDDDWGDEVPKKGPE